MVISKVDAVVEQLMSRIIFGQYPKTIPPQDVLSRELGVSRTVLREAISKLESWNVLAVRPKTGTAVNPSSAWAMVNTELVFSRLKAEGRPVTLADLDRFVEEIRHTLLVAAGFVSEQATIALA